MQDTIIYVLTDDEYPSTAVLFRPGVSPEAVEFGGKERSEDEYQYDEPPDWWGSLIEVSTRWASDGGYRGHTEFDITVGEWERVAAGWVTGYPDDTVPHKLGASEVYEEMLEGNTPDFPVVWLFGVTSNVFSTVSDVYIPDGMTTQWEAFLTALGTRPEAFEGAFR